MIAQERVDGLAVRAYAVGPPVLSELPAVAVEQPAEPGARLVLRRTSGAVIGQAQSQGSRRGDEEHDPADEFVGAHAQVGETVSTV